MGGRHKDSSNYARIIQKKTQKYIYVHDRLQCFQTRPINYNLSRRQTALAEIDSKIGEFICHMANFDTRVLLLEIYHTHTHTQIHMHTHTPSPILYKFFCGLEI